MDIEVVMMRQPRSKVHTHWNPRLSVWPFWSLSSLAPRGAWVPNTALGAWQAQGALKTVTLVMTVPRTWGNKMCMIAMSELRTWHCTKVHLDYCSYSQVLPVCL